MKIKGLCLVAAQPDAIHPGLTFGVVQYCGDGKTGAGGSSTAALPISSSFHLHWRLPVPGPVKVVREELIY